MPASCRDRLRPPRQGPSQHQTAPRHVRAKRARPKRQRRGAIASPTRARGALAKSSPSAVDSGSNTRARGAPGPRGPECARSPRATGCLTLITLKLSSWRLIATKHHRQNLCRSEARPPGRGLFCDASPRHRAASTLARHTPVSVRPLVQPPVRRAFTCGPMRAKSMRPG